MKSLSTLALIAMLFFACKLCDFSGNKTPPPPSPTPTPRPMLYAADLIKQQLGSYSLVKHVTREEMKKTASGFGVQLLNQSSDAGVGQYRSETGKTALLSVYSFSSEQTSTDVMNQLEQESKNRSSRTVILKNTPTDHGKRIKGIGPHRGGTTGRGVWCTAERF